MERRKAVFLDRDGVINEEIGNYVWRIQDFHIIPGIISSLQELKKREYLLIVVTNQAGIAKGLYSRDEMHQCHQYFQEACGQLIDDFYYAPGHPSVSESLRRKPDSLMWEKAIAKYAIEVSRSWMVGDKERDLIPANKLGMKTIKVRFSDLNAETEDMSIADYSVTDVRQLTKIID